MYDLPADLSYNLPGVEASGYRPTGVGMPRCIWLQQECRDPDSGVVLDPQRWRWHRLEEERKERAKEDERFFRRDRELKWQYFLDSWTRKQLRPFWQLKHQDRLQAAKWLTFLQNHREESLSLLRIYRGQDRLRWDRYLDTWRLHLLYKFYASTNRK